MILYFDYFDSSPGLILRFIKYNVVYFFLTHIQINVHDNFLLVEYHKLYGNHKFYHCQLRSFLRLRHNKRRRNFL